MADNMKTIKVGMGLDPQAADPSNPKDGDMFHSDGTPRAEGQHVYFNSQWNELALANNTVRTISSSGSSAIASSDQVIFGDPTAGAQTFTLPTASGNAGKKYIFKKIVAANSITIDPNSSETIDGLSVINMDAEDHTMTIMSDGTNWQIIANDNVGMVLLKDIKTAGNDGGSSVAGNQTRTLNTVQGDGSIVSLSSNQFTLKVGVYRLYATVPGFQCNKHQSSLFDVTGATTVLYGSDTRSHSASVTQTSSVLYADLTVTSDNTYSIQHFTETVQATNGLGIGNGLNDEVYTQVRIEKVK